MRKTPFPAPPTPLEGYLAYPPSDAFQTPPSLRRGRQWASPLALLRNTDGAGSIPFDRVQNLEYFIALLFDAIETLTYILAVFRLVLRFGWGDSAVTR